MAIILVLIFRQERIVIDRVLSKKIYPLFDLLRRRVQIVGVFRGALANATFRSAGRVFEPRTAGAARAVPRRFLGFLICMVADFMRNTSPLLGIRQTFSRKYLLQSRGTKSSSTFKIFVTTRNLYRQCFASWSGSTSCPCISYHTEQSNVAKHMTPA